MSILVCPVCGGELVKENRTLKCNNSHSFDYSKEGYVNLLLGSKSGDKTGDSKESARARHELLNKGYYSCLKEYITSVMSGTVLDICCGEGYYDEYDGKLFGFDISKEMIRLASKGHKDNEYFVANLSKIPVKSGSVDTAIHLFAPFNDIEFSRVLKDDGVLYSVVGGREHLWELKSLLYDTPYKNDEKPPSADRLKLVDKIKVSDRVKINQADLKVLFSMTPYFYHTSDSDKMKLDTVDELELTVEFVIFKYIKTESNNG